MMVKLKAPSVHAIRIVKYIGEHPEKTLGAAEVCRDIQLTQSYFMRIVKDLRKAGILESVQGRYGGFALTRPMEQISLYDIIEAMEGDEPSAETSGMEKLTGLIGKANDQVTEMFYKTNIHQI